MSDIILEMDHSFLITVTYAMALEFFLLILIGGLKYGLKEKYIFI